MHSGRMLVRNIQNLQKLRTLFLRSIPKPTCTAINENLNGSPCPLRMFCDSMSRTRFINTTRCRGGSCLIAQHAISLSGNVIARTTNQITQSLKKVEDTEIPETLTSSIVAKNDAVTESYPKHKSLLPDEFYDLSDETNALLHEYSQSRNPDNLVCNISKQIHKVFRSMCNRLGDIPWIWISTIRGRLSQLQDNGIRGAYTQPLLSHGVFKQMLCDVERCVADLTPKDKIAIISNILSLGIPGSHPAVTSLVNNLHGNCDDMDLSDVTHLTKTMHLYMNKSLMHDHTKLGEEIFQRFVCLFNNLAETSLADVSENDVMLVSQFVSCGSFLLSEALIHKTATYVRDWLQHKTSEITSASTANVLLHISPICRALELFHPVSDIPCTSRDITWSLESSIKEQLKFQLQPWVSTFDSHQMCNLSTVFRERNNHKSFFGLEVRRRSLQLLKSDALRVGDVASVLSAITFEYIDLSMNDARFIESAILRTLHQIDASNINNIINYVIAHHSTNSDLLVALDRAIVKYAHVLVKDFTHVSKLLGYLRYLRRPLRLKSYDVLTPILLHYLDYTDIDQLDYVASILNFLLAQYPSGLPPRIYRKTLEVLPNFSNKNIVTIIRSFYYVDRKFKRTKLEEQLFTIGESIVKILHERLDKINCLHTLLDLTRRLNRTKFKSNDDLMSHIEQRLIKLLPQLSLSHFTNLTSALRNTRLYNVDIIDTIVQFTVDHSHNITVWQYQQLPASLHELIHQTKHTEKLTEILRTKYEGIEKNEYSLYIQLPLLTAWARCGVLSPETLFSVFNLESVTKFDQLIKNEIFAFLRHELMVLNRYAVLDCPHLDIPWFHDSYCDSQFQHKLYDYIECVKDNQGKFVEYQPYKSTSHKPSTLQRVLIEVLPKSKYCMKTHRALGDTLCKKRHMEMLGYKYIQISHYEWNSMGLSRWEEKLQFLYDKLHS